MLYKKLLGATLIPVAALVVATLTSCGGGSSSTAPAIIPARFAYVANNTAVGTVSAFTIDKTSGALSPVSTTSTTANPTSVAVDPGGKYAYVTTFGGTVTAYTIDQVTGALTSPAVSSVYATNTTAIKIHPTLKYAYVADGTSRNVVSYPILANGGFGAGSAVTTGAATTATASSLTIDPLGRFVYVVNNNPGNVSVFVIQANGSLATPGATTAPLAGVLQELAIDPTGQFAYIVNQSSVFLFSINATTGVLTQIGTGVPAGNFPYSVAVSPDGKFAYVVDSSGGTVYIFSIGSTGALTLATVPAPAVNPATAGNGASRITIDPSGSFAYVSNKNASTVSMYTIDRNTGALTPLSAASGGPAVAAGTAPDSITTTR